MVVELVGPTEPEAVRQALMFRHIREIALAVAHEVDEANRCQFTSAIDIFLYRSTGNIDKGVTRDTASPKHRRERIISISVSSHCYRLFLCIITTIATTKDVAPNGATTNIHSSSVAHDTIFTTAIDIPIDSTTADGDICQFRHSQFGPLDIRCTVEQRETSHATAKDIAAIFGTITGSCRITNGAILNRNSDMTKGLAGSIVVEQTVCRVGATICKSDINHINTYGC